LSSDEEFILAKKWKDEQDKGALDNLIESHLKLISKVAFGYRGYGLPLSDLISEGNVGIMQAVKHYDPEKGFRFSTYATFWIKAAINEYVMRMWSFVRVGTTKTQRHLFFKIRQEQNRYLSEHKDQSLNSEKMIEAIAKKLNVSVDEVRSMNQRLRGRDKSLNITATDSSKEWIEWIQDESDNQEIQLAQKEEAHMRHSLLKEAMDALNKQERDILKKRRLKDNPSTLEELSQEYGVSRERIRQIEKKAFLKISKAIQLKTKDNKCFM
jgi:RNA polymerase sigma-32 factor